MPAAVASWVVLSQPLQEGTLATRCCRRYWLQQRSSVSLPQSGLTKVTANPAIEPTAASAPLAVPSALRASAAAHRERWASRRSDVAYGPQ